MTYNATRQLAEFVASTLLSHIPDAVMDRAKYFVLDYLGVALRGSRVDSSAAVQAFVDRFAQPGTATIIGRDQGTHPAYAALANGAAAHCIEMDDTHQEGSVHLGAPIISALIAASEMQPVGGGEVLAGVVRAYSQAPRPERVTQGLGKTFEILATAVKPHACCRYMQAPIDAILELVTAHNIAADEVAQVTLGILNTAFPIICEPTEIKYAPRSIVDAQFSMPFGAVVALLCRRASLAEFTPDMIAAPRVRALMQCVSHVRDPELEQHFPRQWPAWAVIELQDGRKWSTTVRYPKGDPQNPLSWDELRAKYRELGRSVLPEDRLDEICQAVQCLESAADVAPLWRRLRPHMRQDKHGFPWITCRHAAIDIPSCLLVLQR